MNATEVSLLRMQMTQNTDQSEDGFLLVETLLSLSIAAFVIAATYLVLSPHRSDVLFQHAPRFYHQTEVYQSVFSSTEATHQSESIDLKMDTRFDFVEFTIKFVQLEGGFSAISTVGSNE